MLRMQFNNSMEQSSMEDILMSAKTGSLVLLPVNNLVEDMEVEEEEVGLAAVDTAEDMVREDTEEVEVDLEAGMEGHGEDTEVEVEVVDTAVEDMVVGDMVEAEDIAAAVVVEEEAHTLMEDMGEEILTHLRHRMTSLIMPRLAVMHLQSFLFRMYYPPTGA